MAIGETIGKDIIVAMKAKDSFRTETLRMAKSALKSKEIDKRQPLTDAEELSILQTMVKQRKDAAEQFTKGNRPELAAKELEEIKKNGVESKMGDTFDEASIMKLDPAKLVGQIKMPSSIGPAV